MASIAYLSHVDVQSSRAHVHNSLKTCEALLCAGNTILFVNPDHRPSDLDVIFAKHGIQKKFDTNFLGSVSPYEQNHPVLLKRFFAVLRMNFSFIKYLIRHRSSINVVFYRHHLIFPSAVFAKWVLHKLVIFESHYVFIKKPISQKLTDFAVYSASGVVTITEALRKYYKLSPNASVVSPCHAAEFELVPKDSKEYVRKEMGIPLDVHILCYTGSLGETIQGISYEVESIIDILPNLSNNFVTLIVGARDGRKDAEILMKHAENLGVSDRVIIKPWCDRDLVMKYLVAADILLMPRVGVAPGSSPSKMFDYLAVGRPIIAASTPPVEEVLKQKTNALLVNADDKQQWISSILLLIENKDLSVSLVHGALHTAHEYTWIHRGEIISNFIDSIYDRTA